jgi:hypothetical protein
MNLLRIDRNNPPDDNARSGTDDCFEARLLDVVG